MMKRFLLVALFSIPFVAAFATTALANPKQAAVHDKQAKAYFDAKQYDQAIEHFKKSYDLHDRSVTLFKIASAYYQKGDYKGAIDYYQKYLQADPEGPLAAQAIEFSTIANKAIQDEQARQQAKIEAARIETVRKAAEAEKERRRIAATAHRKQAEAYAQAGAWASAGEEYRSAAEVGQDPAELIDAAEAFGKQPDHIRARAAYLAYLENVPLGPRSDELRGKVADLTRAIDEAKAVEEERQRRLAEAITNGPGKLPEVPRKRFKRGWIVVGSALLLSGLVADLAAPNGDNGVLDASDFAPVALYGLGATAVLSGVF